MKKKKVVLSLVLLLFAQVFVAQIVNEFYSEATGTIGDRQKINAMAFTTSNKIDLFFNAIEKELGAPNFEEKYYVYKTQKKDWSKKEIIIRLEPIIQNNLDGSSSYTVFIFAEENDGADLLLPSSDSYKLILQYFSNLFEKHVKKGVQETFPKD